MDERGGSAVARPRIHWGEAALAQHRQQDAEPMPVGDALSEAAGTLEHERQKHEKRCALRNVQSPQAVTEVRISAAIVGA